MSGMFMVFIFILIFLAFKYLKVSKDTYNSEDNYSSRFGGGMAGWDSDEGQDEEGGTDEEQAEEGEIDEGYEVYEANEVDKEDILANEDIGSKAQDEAPYLYHPDSERSETAAKTSPDTKAAPKETAADAFEQQITGGVIGMEDVTGVVIDAEVHVDAGIPSNRKKEQ